MRVRAKAGLKFKGQHHFAGEKNEEFEVTEEERAELGDLVVDVTEPIAEPEAASGEASISSDATTPATPRKRGGR